MFINRGIFFIIIWLSCSLATLAQSIRQYDLFDGKTRVDIPFRYQNNFMIVDIVLDGKVPLKFVFDTGAEYTILTKKSISYLLGWRYEREFRIMGADMKTELVAYLVKNISLEVGKVKIPRSNILVLEDDYFQFDEFAGTHIQGIVGADFFKHFVVKINYRSKTISLYHPNGFKSPKGFQEIGVDIRKNKPYVEANIAVKDTTKSKMCLLVDTGASLPLLLHNFTHPDLHLPQNYVQGNLGMGLGGFIEGYMGRLSSISLGKYNFQNLLANYQEYSEERDTSFLNGRNGLLGNGILDRFTIIIDYFHSKMFIKPNKNFNKGIQYDRSGIILLATGTRFTTFIVYEVLDNSPAANAGVKKGDIIRKVNGVSSSFSSLRGISRKFQKKAGTRIKLVIKRDEKRMKKVFYLKDLI